MNILETIIAYKREEVKASKALITEDTLKESNGYSRRCLSLAKSLLKENASGIIAEFKRRSPSKGFINEHADALAITTAYTHHGASGLSVLTDNHFFGGSKKDLIAARQNAIPILRKDFIIDAYQIAEAKAMGADVILLIAACLSVTEVKTLAAAAKQAGMEVLLELHEEEELNHICDDTDMVGINNRSLKTFDVDINRALELSRKIPAGKIKIAESGITNPSDIKIFRNAGYKGFLIGENFMKAASPGNTFEQFVKNIS